MLTRQEIESGYFTELDGFAALLRSVDESSWSRATRCEGWSVADVAAHVVGGTTDVVSFNLDGAGSPEWTARQVDERRGRKPGELADELEATTKIGSDVLAGFDQAAWDGPAPAGIPGSVGRGVEGLWYDAYVHADDIRAASGAPSERGPGLRASVHHVAWLLDNRGWGPATLAVDGVEQVAVGSGGGRKVTGDALEFVLVATGRADPSSLGLDPSVNVYG